VTVGFFGEFEGIEESSTLGPFSGEWSRRVAFEGSSIGCCYLRWWWGWYGHWLLCSLLLRGTLLSKKLRVDLGEVGHCWLDCNLAGRHNWLGVDWYFFSLECCLLDVREDLVGF
jgi:hypothetical protein